MKVEIRDEEFEIIETKNILNNKSLMLKYTDKTTGKKYQVFFTHEDYPDLKCAREQIKRLVYQDLGIEEQYEKERIYTDYTCPHCKNNSEIINKKICGGFITHFFNISECKNCGNQFFDSELEEVKQEDYYKNDKLMAEIRFKKGILSEEQYFKNIDYLDDKRRNRGLFFDFKPYKHN